MKKLLIITIVIISIISCKIEDHALLPEVTTDELINDSEFSATAKGTVISDGGASVTERGICWSTNQMPTINDEFTIEGSGIGDFTNTLTELVQGTTYYARAYATNRKGTVYGETFSFVAGTITDVEGNIYNMVTIGTQIWMKESLIATKYNDGTSIPLVTVNSAWVNIETPAYCWYDNDASTNKDGYGALYNWYAVNNEKICPTGWHVPNDSEWTTLIDFLGGVDIAGGKLKESGFLHWLNPNFGATNEVGFTAVASGLRDHNGDFVSLKTYGNYWSSSIAGSHTLWTQFLFYQHATISKGTTPMDCGAQYVA